MRIPFTNYEIRMARPHTAPAPDADYWYSTATYESKSGIDVNQDNALTYAAVWACVKVISEDLASLPLFVYRRDGTAKERATDHPLFYLLHDAPNPEMTAMQFREALQAHLLLWGNAYAEIQRNLRGDPIALWPLNPGNMAVKRPENALVYEYTLENSGQKVTFAKEDVLHIAGLGFNGLVGYSPISYQREAIAVGLSAQDYQATNLKNGGRLQLAFVHPAPVAPKKESRDQFKNELRKEYGGQTGQRVGVFWEGMEPKVIGMTMEDQQFIDGMKLNQTDICSIFRVPPQKIMNLERATFSNIESQAISYVVDTIRPWAVRWEQAINQRLLNGSSKFFVEHLVDGLLRGDIKSRYDAYSVGRQWGWLSVNDVRQLENMNPVANGGDDYMTPLNMGKLGEEPPEPKPAPKEMPALSEEQIAQAASAFEQHLKLIRR